MKTVGIITVHRLPNWGSAMQAYALQKAINSLGYKSQIIDYKHIVNIFLRQPFL